MKKQSIILSWVLGVPVVAALGFVVLSAVFYQEPAEKFQHDGNVAALLSEVQRLENDLSNHPEQPEKSLILAHSYRAMGKYSKAILAYGNAWPLIENSPDNLVAFAETLARQRGNDFKGKPLQLITQALNLEPSHIDALILKGTALLQQKDYTQAITLWQKAYQLLPITDSRRDELQMMLQELKASKSLIKPPKSA